MLAIFADDLTGALDSAAPFAARGLHTEVALDADGIGPALALQPAVVSINLGSRDGKPEAAADATRSALSQLPAGTQVLKKIDSRLKGHIAIELAAIPFHHALVAPAIPEFGRIVASGTVTGFGVDTPIAIAEKLSARAKDCTIPDIATEAEMRDALERAFTAGVDLLVGARGLADALARRMTGDAAPKLASIPKGRALFVIGSRDPITVAQIDALKRLCEVDDRLAPNGQLTDAEPNAQSLTLVRAVQGQGVCSGQEAAACLAASVVPAMTHAASTLLLSGGSTAEAVLSRMGISRFRLLGECLPGLGLAYVDGQCIIAKSGGFGQPDTLVKIAAATGDEMGR